MNSIVPSTPQHGNHAFYTFDFGGLTIRIIERDGEPWFAAVDVCQALGLSNTTRAVQRLDDDEKALTPIQGSPTPVNIVNESGLYSLVLGSDKPQAKEFKRWITHEVIPQIRKTGVYVAKAMSPAEMLVAQAQALLDHERRMEALEQRQDELAAQVGAQNEYFTIYAFCRLKGIPSPNAENARLYGRRCSEYSRKAGISIGKIAHQQHGYVQTYRTDVLEAILLPPMLKGE